jgi:putative transposase
MDFMHDPLGDGRRFRVFNGLDDFHRDGLVIDADLSLPAVRVVRVLDPLLEWRGKPTRIRCDNGPEYVSDTMHQWARRHGIPLDCIQPGKPQQNAYIERYNRTVRYD